MGGRRLFLLAVAITGALVLAPGVAAERPQRPRGRLATSAPVGPRRLRSDFFSLGAALPAATYQVRRRRSQEECRTALAGHDGGYLNCH